MADDQVEVMRHFGHDGAWSGASESNNCGTGAAEARHAEQAGREGAMEGRYEEIAFELGKMFERSRGFER